MTITRFRQLAIALVACAALAPATVSAAFIDLIDNGTTTVDTLTGLEWLDLTQSTSRSYADVSGQFGAGGDFEGWRHATFSEVGALFTNAGFPPPFGPLSPDPQTTALMVAFIHLIGATVEFTDALGTELAAVGFYNDDGTGSIAGQSGHAAVRYDGRLLFPEAHATVFIDTFPTNQAFATIGHFLVRAPEPGALALLATGLAGLGIARRRRVKGAA